MKRISTVISSSFQENLNLGYSYFKNLVWSVQLFEGMQTVQQTTEPMELCNREQISSSHVEKAVSFHQLPHTLLFKKTNLYSHPTDFCGVIDVT